MRQSSYFSWDLVLLSFLNYHLSETMTTNAFRPKSCMNPASVLLNSRDTGSHVIAPLDDIIAEDLGQRGRRGKKLPCWTDTITAGLCNALVVPPPAAVPGPDRQREHLNVSRTWMC
uniref:Uncharacterized protein n=1 Tax=Poecilia latipinna TaxID=48699 RepID=A0A3B3VSJ2_9TELE